MTLVARTNYAADAIGGLDPLWVPDGRHTCPTNQNAAGIGIEIDPFGSNEKVLAYHLKSGCVLFGGDRCETTTPRINMRAGERKQTGFSVAIPSSFKSGGSRFNSLCDFHNPNTGPAQSPITLSVRNNREVWLWLNTGPLSSDKTQGTFQRDIHLADLTVTKYMNIILDVHASPNPDGYIAVYCDGVKRAELTCPTLDAGPVNNVYWKQGHYRHANNGLPGDYYMKDTATFTSENANEPLAWFRLPPVVEPPVPVPDPSSDYQKALDAITAIEKGNPKIAAAMRATLQFARSSSL